MATTDNKIINGSGLSELSSQIKSYVNDKTEISVGATAPTDNKIKLWVDTSATGEIAWNDITGKPDLATKSEVQQVEDKIPAPYTLPKATTSTLGGVMPDGSTITIADGVISSNGSGSATVYRFSSTNTLTQEQKNQLIDCAKNREKIAFINGELVISVDIEYYDKDKTIPNHIYFTTITNMDRVYDAQGDYDYGRTSRYNYYEAFVFSNNNSFISQKTNIFTGIEEVKRINWSDLSYGIQKGEYDWMIDWAKGKNYQVWIDHYLVYYITKFNNQLYLHLLGCNGSSSWSSSTATIYFTDTTFTKLDTTHSYSSFATNTLLTSDNWQNYITLSGSNWQNTTTTSDSNLYNAKEVVIFWTDTQSSYHQTYLNVGCDYSGNSGSTWGTSNWMNTQIYLDGWDEYNGAYITYDGSNVNVGNCSISAICYKT